MPSIAEADAIYAHMNHQMRRGLGISRGAARRDRSSFVVADMKFGRSHNRVFMCFGFIFVFFGAVTIVSYRFEPSILIASWVSNSNDLGLASEESSATQNLRTLVGGGLRTTLELQQDIWEEHRLGSDSKNVRIEGKVTAHVPVHYDETNPLGLAAGLKIFVYDLPSKYNIDWLNDSRCANHLFAAEVALHQILLESPLRTMDPDSADFFFVPVYVSCNFSPKSGLPSLSNARKMMKSAVEFISREMTFWNRSRGSDHVFVATHDYGTCFHVMEEIAAAVGVPGFLRQSIILQTFGQLGGHPCQDVENIRIPPYVSPVSLQKYWRPVEEQERTIWAHFRGKLELHPKNVSGNFYSKGVRTRIWHKFKTDERFFLRRKRDDNYQSEMLHSKFCLAPLGWAPWSPRIVESVVLGCVPVIIADNIALPHSHVIDWPSISLTVAEKDVDKLDQILQHVVATNLTTIQENLWKVENRRALLYIQPLLQGDASWHIFDLLARKKLERQQQSQTTVQ